MKPVALDCWSICMTGESPKKSAAASCQPSAVTAVALGGNRTDDGVIVNPLPAKLGPKLPAASL